MEQKHVTIYSTPSCQYCNAAKEFFQQNDVEYTDYDVCTDQERRQEMIEKSGQMGVPVIFIGDDMVIGFNEEKLAELLGIE